MRNLLLFEFNRDFGDDIVVVANNIEDLKDYLIKELGFYSVDGNNKELYIKETIGATTEYVQLKWIKHI